MISIDNRNKCISALLTLIVFVVALLWLLLTRLSFNLNDSVEWPPKPDAEILLADEFIEVEMLPPVIGGGGSVEDDGATPPPPIAHDLVNQGQPATAPSQIVTSTQESPVKAPPVVDDPRPVGPSQAEIEAEKAKEKAEKEAAERANNRVQFGQTPGATGTGDGVSGTGAGSGDGRSSRKGQGDGRVNGREFTYLPVVESSNPGNITVKIRVNPAGQVTVLEVVPGATVDPETRKKCEEAARKAKVRPSNKSTDDIGSITWRFN